ncbi:MAG: M28 family peptidase [Micromonosporaceae bacterium]
MAVAATIAVLTMQAARSEQQQDPLSAALATADRLTSAKAAELLASDGDKFQRKQAITTPWGLQYVSYERTHRGLPVVGGDFVVVTDRKGGLLDVTSGQDKRIALSSLTPQVSLDKAGEMAATALTVAEPLETDPRLVVYALGTPRLAWESVVQGRDESRPSRKKVYVDARTGTVLDEVEQVAAGTGTGVWNGSNLSFGTTQSGGSYTMSDPARPGLRCADFATDQVFTDSDDVWGSTSGTDKVAGCVDVMYIAGGEWDMLKSWYGRNGLDGNGNWADAEVGLQEQNAYWGHSNNPDGVVFGRNSANKWITGADVVGHEYGHGLDAKTPGGIAGYPSQEFVADVWGTLTEHYLNNPNDAPDYQIGELINLQGNGAIRHMYKPSTISGHPDCWSSSLPSSVHAAAGPGNHWFYLLAEGTSPGNGKPNSPTCNNTTMTGIGHREAGKIFYNAMLMKTSGMNYQKWRIYTLTAAKNLDATCGYYNKVKAAWDAVSLPAQSGEPSCTGSTPTSSPTTSPTSSPTASPTSSPPVGVPNIDVEKVKAHLQQLQTIASNNGGNRRSTGGGYTASVTYLEEKLKAAGYNVVRQPCTSGCTSGAGPNLIADWPGGDANEVYVFGGHLDSVSAGPGINDNGTGSALLLETALTLAAQNPTMAKHVRFGWWTDEEQGLNGSEFYTNSLPTAERSKIKGYLNFDMNGSTNAGYFIDNVTGALAGNLKGYFDSINVPVEEMTECCSDDGSFRNIGVPTTFLSTGAGATKSSTQAQKWGGTAGQAFDPCYHKSCDTYPSNINTTALDRNSDAAAYALWKLAVSGGPSPTGSPTASPTTSPTASPTPPPTTSPPPTPGGRTFTNDTNYAIYDNLRIYSPVNSTASGAAATTVSLSINIQHTCAEDLGISLVAPDGTIYPVKYSGGYYCTSWNGAKPYQVTGVSETASGTWQLRVTDYGPGDTGFLDSWTVTL